MFWARSEFVPVASSLVLSAADIEPAAEVVAAEIETAGVVVPVTTMGAVPLTAETAAPEVTESSFVLSAADKVPAAETVAAEIEMAGVVVGEVTERGAEALTLVTVPLPPPVLVVTLRSTVIVIPRALVSVMGGLDD